MDNYITLAELRKTAEALLIKTNNELENKVSIDEINNQTGNADDYDYTVASIGDKDLIVKEDWVINITNNIIDNYQPPVTSVNGQTGDVDITIPSVPSWALATEKPTYTAAEVGALPDSTVIPEDKIFVAIKDVTTYAEVKSAIDAGKVVFAKDVNLSSALIHWRLSSINQTTTPECFFVDIAGYDGANSTHRINYLRLRSPNTWYQNYWTIPYQTSNLTNDSDFQTSTDVNSLIATAIGNINSFNISVVSELPSSNIDTHTIYFLSNSGASPDSYDEYMYISNNWEKIGNTAVDLSGYVLASNTKGIYTTEITRSETGDNLYFKTQSVTITGASYDTTLAIKPQYAVITAHKDDNGESTNQAILVTATETTINNIVTPTSNLMAANKKYVDDTVSAATSSHVHGSITNSGDITTTATIANGDRLVINDESASKITNSSITFGTSTAQYLANNGTWQSVPTTLPASDVSDWAKAATKPTYTAEEVGALPSTTTYVSAVNGQTGNVTISDSDEKVKSTPLNGVNSTRGLLISSNTGASETTNTVFTTDKLAWNDYSPGLYIYNTGKSKYLHLSYSGIRFPNDTNSYSGSLKIAAVTANRTYSLPDASGTIALTSDIPTQLSQLNNDSGFITSYTETDPVFAASAAAGITATDISNWNAKVSDDKTWNGVTLNKGSNYVKKGECYIPYLDSYNQTTAYTGKATATPTATRFVKYDDDAYLNSTTPSASDNSTKVATTAYVTTAISNITYPVTSVNGQTGAVSVTEPLYISFSYDEATEEMTCNRTYNEILNAYNNNIPILSDDGSPTINIGSNYIDLIFTHNTQTSGEMVEVNIKMYKMTIASSNTIIYTPGNTFWPDTPTSVVPALSSGTLIATINGQEIYAPSYTDADGVSY